MNSRGMHDATSNKNVFTSYRIGNFRTLKMKNFSCSKILGIGDVFLQTNVSYTLLLKDIRHVPDLRLNLISWIALNR